MYVKEAISLILPYARKRILDQVKALLFIILYLIGFQYLVLGLPIHQAATIGAGLVLVVFGLAFFMEGLTLGLMPLGESIGLRLPRKAPVVLIMLFAFCLGVMATFAEPAISVLRAAGSEIKPWEAPLLYRLLNTDTHLLIAAVAIGVGIAVCFGVLRFIFNLSLKPFLLAIVGSTLSLTVYCWFEPNLQAILGLAWDCGAVTTGPVTVPLVLALGIGISRVMAANKSDLGGFGIVTLASILPILSVLVLSIGLNSSTPSPVSKSDFEAASSEKSWLTVFGSAKAKSEYATGDLPQPSQRSASRQQTFSEIISSNCKAALQAIVPLCLLMLTALFLIREKLQRPDEVLFGIFIAIIGFAVFNVGITLGLANLGKQTGQFLPSSYKEIELDRSVTVQGFSPDLTQSAITDDGQNYQFFYHKSKSGIKPIEYDPSHYDAGTRTYSYPLTQGPLIGSEGSNIGIILVLVFAFLMGYGATLAEPALNALGNTVEEITAGNFKKSALIQSVAIGVGAGLSTGVAKIIWDLPIAPLLLAPYALLLVLTILAREELVNIAWDSAGVTTGPITVPLVIAMGLGLGSQSAVIEGFGILSLASVGPILVVITAGMMMQRSQTVSRAEPKKDYSAIKNKNEKLEKAS